MASHLMGRKYDKYQILRQKDPREVASNAFEVALEFALLGHIDKATELFRLFGEFASGAKAAWSPGLYFAWEATGLWPASIAEEERSPDFLRKFETERILWKREANMSPEGLDKLIAVATGAGQSRAWRETHFKADDLTAALDLALFLGEKGKAHELLQTLADNFHECCHVLPRSRQAWKLLKDQALARAIGIDSAKLEAFYTDVYTTFKQRLERGATRVWKTTPTAELVQRCNNNTIKNAVWEEMDVDPDEPPETILQPGATEEQIAAAETRLGYTLPDDIKDFFRATNGMGSVWNGFYGEPRFFAVDEIHFVDAAEQQKEWEKAAVDIVFVSDMSIKPRYPQLKPTIKIADGGEESKFVWLVPPEAGQAMGAAFFETVARLPEQEQQHIMKMLGYMQAGIDRSDMVGWQVIVWCPRELSLVNYHSFKEYLELLSEDAAKEDILEEEDEQGRLLHSSEVFAYQLR